MKADRRRPRHWRRPLPGWWTALALAIVVNLLFVGVLIFSLHWQNRPAPPVTAELYAPQVVERAPEPRTEPKPEPPPPPPPPPEPKPEPQPEPKAEPKVEPKPPAPKPEPKAERPDSRAAEIAQKVRQEEERRLKALVQERERREAEAKKLAEEKRQAETKARREREVEALRQQAEREAAQRAQAEAVARAKAETEAKVRAEADARARAEADWIRRIQSKIRGNVVLPPELPGNPEAVFEVVLLPTGEILDAQLRKSSGVRAYDEAVQRAILKSTPLPRPDRAEIFQRTLTLKFRPLD